MLFKIQSFLVFQKTTVINKTSRKFREVLLFKIINDFIYLIKISAVVSFKPKSAEEIQRTQCSDAGRQKRQDKGPRAAKTGHPVGHHLAECRGTRVGRGPGQGLAGFDAVQHLMLQIANLAALIRQHLFNI